jgi:hypothetical protein
LDYRYTLIGELSLRRRKCPSFDTDVFEVKLGNKFLMSSLFAASEIALATMGAGAANAGQLSLTAAAATVAGFLMPLAKGAHARGYA